MKLHPGEILYIFFLGVVLYLVLKRQFFAPVGRILEEREILLEEAQGFISMAESEIEEKKALIESGLARASADAYEINETYRQEGHKQRKDILHSAQDNAYKMLSDARVEILRSAQEAETKLNEDADRLAGEIAEILLGRKIHG